MSRGGLLRFFLVLVVFGRFWQPASGESIPVLQRQGAMHGFLILRGDDHKIIASGDQINIAQGNRIRSRLVLHFRDGSVDDETAVFKQGKAFELLSDRHIQKGPAFPDPLDMAVDVPSGKVTWRERKDGKDQMKSEHMNLPTDLANGMMALTVQNFPSTHTDMKVSYLVAAPKPRLVKLSIKRAGDDECRIGNIKRLAELFKVHVELGGLAGLVAPLIGKEPPDVELWVLKGEAPAFLKMQGPLYLNGPVWQMELSSPAWPEEK